MARNPAWSDEYWLLLMQLYLKKPVGLKPLYSRGMVALGLELHIKPEYLYKQMFKLRQLDTPRMERLWNTYANNPKKLSHGVNRLRQMHGFGLADEFYEGVEINESWEKDFKPLPQDPTLLPIHLIIILDLYFRLTPITMVAATPEIVELGKILKLEPRKIADIMDIYQFCDPYLNSADLIISPLLAPCEETWQRYGNANPEKLAALAAQLKDYFL